MEIKYKIGDKYRDGELVLPPSKRKKILLLSDDLRMNSGIATMSKELVFGTFHKYDWVQLGAAINHPEQGKEIDLGDSVRQQSGVENASFKLIPWKNYGDSNILRQLLMRHQPDAILHFTDPRYWRWLYEIEAEVRENCPIFYYNIWDNVGTPPDFSTDPHWNRDFYESCDWLGAISKQTYGMNKRIGNMESSTRKKFEDWQISYVPHGIDENVFKPTNVPTEFKKDVLNGKDYDFVLFWSNRNIRRKQASDVIWAFRKFWDTLPEPKRKRVCLIMHTNPIDENGTDLYAVKNAMAPDCDIKFSQRKLQTAELNYLYNIADCTINIAGNEGFGLTTAESLMAGTPIIVNVTGGLQDQCGFKINKGSKMAHNPKPITAEDYVEIGTLHDYKEWKDNAEHGDWVYPVWSKVRSVVGSVPTPYILDDKVDVDDVAEAIKYWYDTSKIERDERGTNGRNWMIGEGGLTTTNMCTQLVNGMEKAMKNYKPKKRFTTYKIK